MSFLVSIGRYGSIDRWYQEEGATGHTVLTWVKFSKILLTVRSEVYWPARSFNLIAVTSFYANILN